MEIHESQNDNFFAKGQMELKISDLKLERVVSTHH